MVATTLVHSSETSSGLVSAVFWRGTDQVHDTLAEWLGKPIDARNWEAGDDTRAVLILNVLRYPAWKRVWDNPEDSAYDQLLYEL